MSDTPDRRPSLTAVLETSLYYSDQLRTERFYSEVLGLRLLDREPGRSLFYRLGDSILLLFDAAATIKGGSLPPHGATGAIHVCLRCEPEMYDPWKCSLENRGIELLKETNWKPGRSFYFHDPDRNLLEIADRDIWPG